MYDTLDALRITVHRNPDDDSPYRASSPDWPGCEGRGWDVSEAVQDLVHELEGALPLSAATIESLRAVGGDRAVAAWDRNVRGAANRVERHAGVEAGRLLQPYKALGLTPEAATAWFAMGVRAQVAGALEQDGWTTESYADYECYYYEATSDRKWHQAEIASAHEWALAGVPLKRAVYYTDYSVPFPDAVDGWEPLIGFKAGVQTRLHLYLRLGIGPAEATELEGSAVSDRLLVGQLETLLALRRQASP